MEWKHFVVGQYVYCEQDTTHHFIKAIWLTKPIYTLVFGDGKQVRADLCKPHQNPDLDLYGKRIRKFKRGDKVICRNANGAEICLEEGKIYTVNNYGFYADRICLVDGDDYFKESRFELASSSTTSPIKPMKLFTSNLGNDTFLYHITKVIVRKKVFVLYDFIPEGRIIKVDPVGNCTYFGGIREDSLVYEDDLGNRFDLYSELMAGDIQVYEGPLKSNPKPMFKKGDKVECISAISNKLKVGEMYTISSVASDDEYLYLSLEGLVGTWYSSNFKLAEQKKEISSITRTLEDIISERRFGITDDCVNSFNRATKRLNELNKNIEGTTKRRDSVASALDDLNNGFNAKNKAKCLDAIHRIWKLT